MGEEKEEQVEEKQSFEIEKSKKDENILNFLDSMDSYLILMDQLSSILRQGWLELASARHSMGASRISSALFDLKYHSAATSLQVNQDGSSTELPNFTLCKWASPNEEKCYSEEAKEKEDELLKSMSSSPQLRHRGSSEKTDSEEKKLETSGSSLGVDDQARKERLKSLSMFGTLVSPKLRAAQLSFETALEMLVETANTRALLMCAYDDVRNGIERTEK